MKKLKLCGGVVWIILISMTLHAQRERRSVSVSFKEGTNLFYGDVGNLSYKTIKDENIWSLGYAFDLNWRIKPYLTLRASLEKGKLSGSKPERNIWFNADLLETDIGLKFDILNIFKNKHRRFNPYAGVGVGLLQYNSTLMSYPDNGEIARKGYGNGKGFDGMTSETEMPVIAGLNIYLGKHIDLMLEGNINIVNSDELDVKKGGSRYDMFGFYAMGVTYHFTKKASAHLPVRPERKSIAATHGGKTVAAKNKDRLTPEKTAEIAQKQKAKTEATKKVDKIMAEKERKVQLGKPSFENVRFYVQVAASQKPINRAIIAKSIGYPEKSVSVLKNNGWYKFVVGNYKQYWEAKNQRNILISKNNVRGAFVVATKNDAFISVDELLTENPGNNKAYSLKKHNESGIVYSVQILAARKSGMEASGIKAIFDLDEEVYMEESDGLKRYTVGSFNSVAKAVELLRKVVDKGISDAFVVAYKDGKRIPLDSVSH